MSSRPTIGRVVHYKSFGTPGGEYQSLCRAAIVTDIGPDPEVVGLAVLNPTGLFFDPDIRQDEAQSRGGTWHWPCVITDEKPIHYVGVTGALHALPNVGEFSSTDDRAKVTCQACREMLRGTDRETFS